MIVAKPNLITTSPDRIIKVLVVDDSAYIRKVIKQMLQRSPFIEVVGTATNGKHALEMVEELKPDVVTLDLIMPEMDGIEFLKHQMSIKPIPVVIVSIASETGELALKALDLGAVDFIQKPTALATEKVFEIADELIEVVKHSANVRLENLLKIPQKAEEISVPEITTPKTSIHKEIVVIGISTGGPQALKTIIPVLPKSFPIPIAIVLHMPVGYTELYARSLNDISKLEVKEAEFDDELKAGVVYLAPAGKHLSLKKGGNGKVFCHLDLKPFDTLHRPSVDVLFKSAAEVFGEKVLGIIMTGMGTDGRDGCASIKAKGGKIITESEETCVVYGMPRSVDEAQLSDKSVPLYKMIETIMEEI